MNKAGKLTLSSSLQIVWEGSRCCVVQANRKLPKNKYVLRQQRLDIHLMVLCMYERHIHYFRCARFALNRKEKTESVQFCSMFWKIRNQHPYSACTHTHFYPYTCTLIHRHIHTHTHIHPHIFTSITIFLLFWHIAFLCLSPMNRNWLLSLVESK